MSKQVFSLGVIKQVLSLSRCNKAGFLFFSLQMACVFCGRQITIAWVFNVYFNFNNS